jgi:hypothetical protein
VGAQNASRNANSKDCGSEVSDRNKDSIGNKTRDHSVIFWQRTCLHFVCVLRLCGRLSLKVTDWSNRKFQGKLVFKLSHAFYYLFLSRFTMKTGSKK